MNSEFFTEISPYLEKSGSSADLTEDSSSTLASQGDSDQDPNDITLRQKWVAFQRISYTFLTMHTTLYALRVAYTFQGNRRSVA